MNNDTSVPEGLLSPILLQLNALLTNQREAIGQWFAEAYRETPPHLYSSVDIRHAGFKLAPVDTNLFPAGFNNLSAGARHLAMQRFRDFLAQHYPQAKRIALIPENHTRNLNYLDNLAYLRDLLQAAGAETRIGWLELTADDESPTPSELMSASGVLLTVRHCRREGAKLVIGEDFIPDLVVLNNDLTSGIPELLRDIEQPLVPPPSLGWHRRLKSSHFAAYEKVVGQFCRQFGLDPWLISTHSQQCGLVNFHERTNIDCVAMNVEKVLHGVRRKYQEYGITSDPYVFIKADSGTYGMGIMTVYSGEEVLEMNKKIRNKMSVIKEGTVNTRVIIQEGVPTIDRVEGVIAEPMVYVVNGLPVGGAYRINHERDAYNNLNARGMEFRKMRVPEADEDTTQERLSDVPLPLFRAYCLITRLASLAAAREVVA
jgi:glutamate--cysteine ligase